MTLAYSSGSGVAYNYPIYEIEYEKNKVRVRVTAPSEQEAKNLFDYVIEKMKVS